VNRAALEAYASFAGRIAATRMGAASPFKITLSLTDRCDCRCRGCFIWAREDRPEPAPQDVERLLRGLESLRWVNLTGGEIFLRDDVSDVAAAVKRAVPRLAVLDFPTTGQQPERIAEDVGRMAALGIPRLLVTVSLEGPPEHHDRARGREGAFESACRTFALLRRIPKTQVVFGMTLTSENADRIPETLAAVRARQDPGEALVDWKDLHLNVWTRSAHYYANEKSRVRAPDAVGRAVGPALRARRGSTSPVDAIEATYLRLLPAYLETGRSPLPCKSLVASVFVATNGDVHPCTVWDRPLGNAYRTPLREILATETARRTRDEVARDRCPGCWSPCEANPTIVASAPESLFRRPRR
jgi:MoaA/NifB/PqqE/SkfB family radical SAM enzyme